MVSLVEFAGLCESAPSLAISSSSFLNENLTAEASSVFMTRYGHFTISASLLPSSSETNLLSDFLESWRGVEGDILEKDTYLDNEVPRSPFLHCDRLLLSSLLIWDYTVR